MALRSSENTFVGEGLVVCGVNTAPRRGTQAFSGNNLPPQRSNCDISLYLCDTLSLRLIISHDKNPTLSCNSRQLFKLSFEIMNLIVDGVFFSPTEFSFTYALMLMCAPSLDLKI